MEILLGAVFLSLVLGGFALYVRWSYRVRTRESNDLRKGLGRLGEQILGELRDVRQATRAHQALLNAVRGIEAHVEKERENLASLHATVLRIEQAMDRSLGGNKPILEEYAPSGGLDDIAEPKDEGERLNVADMLRRLKEGPPPEGYEVVRLELEVRGDPARGVPVSLKRKRGSWGGLLWIAEDGRQIGRVLGDREALDPEVVRAIWGRAADETVELPSLAFRMIPAGTSSPGERPFGQDIDRWIPAEEGGSRAR